LLFLLLVLSTGAFAQNGGPFVSLDSPTNGASFTAPANITLSATASDSAGQITSVDFFAGNTLIGRAISAPYSITWSNVAAGTYALTAVASDNVGLNATSNQVTITVNGGTNQPPSVSITSPANNAIFTAPASITVSATASDSDGTVTQVQFFAGATLIGTDTTSPYSITWSNVAAGAYSLAAVATDNAGAKTTSAAVSITVNSTTTPLYQGFLDGVSCSSIVGWAWDAHQPNNHINVDIYDGSKLLLTTTASLFRQDLLNAGIGNGDHAFNVATPSSIIDGAAHTISAKFGGTATSLSTSPKTVTCTLPGGVIQGFKIDSSRVAFNSPGATITIDGTQSFGPTVNPYASSVSAGSHTVTSSIPAGFSVA
jgi:hypothetical protein